MARRPTNNNTIFF